MKFIRNLTNRLTMYAVAGLALSIIWLAAFVFSLTGFISVNPSSLLLATAILTVVGAATGALAAWLAGTKQHILSPLISAFILVLTFTPRSGLDGIIIPLSLSLIMTVSKYLIAYRGRHIFNPAATTMVIATYVGIAAPSWWVATPPLFPFIVVAGFIVLVKVRKIEMATIYILLALAGTVWQQMNLDETFINAVRNGLASWPILFFAGFMLSEPLTMPPRRHEQNTFATGVALLSFFVSLPMSLVLGNLYAFLTGQRGDIQLRLKSKKLLTEDIYEFSFEPNRQLKFAPGQYIELSLPSLQTDIRGERRMFSIASSPSEPVLRLAMRIPKRASRFKQHLSALKPGDTVPATAIAGDFVLPKPGKRPLLLIAGGIGITPFISQLKQLETMDIKRDITLIYLVRSKKDAAYSDWLSKKSITLKLIEKSKPLDLRAYKNHDAFVSGPPDMVDMAVAELRRNGNRYIRTDHFSGY